MNMKKIMAGVVASVMAVGTMAVAASADTTGYALFGADWGEPTVEANGIALSGNWNGAGIALPEDVVEAANGDFSNITLTFEITVGDIDADAQIQKDAYGDEESDHVIGDMVVAFVGNNTPFRDGFGLIQVAEGDSDGGYAKTYSVTAKASAINMNDDGTFYAQVQNGAVTDTTWTVTYTVAGNDEPTATGTDDGEDDNNAASDDNGSTSTPTDDKQNADTGVEGVAVVAGLAIIAAGAVVVAKKRG